MSDVLVLPLQLAHQTFTRSAQLGSSVAVKRRDTLRPDPTLVLLLDHVVMTASAPNHLHPSIRQNPQCGIGAVLAKAVTYPVLHVPTPNFRAKVCGKEGKLNTATPCLGLY